MSENQPSKSWRTVRGAWRAAQREPSAVFLLFWASVMASYFPRILVLVMILAAAAVLARAALDAEREDAESEADGGFEA